MMVATSGGPGYTLDLLTPLDLVRSRPNSSIRHCCLGVFAIRWDKAGSFKIVTFKPGEWERTLRAAAQISKTS
jgi:hypothetical protein